MNLKGSVIAIEEGLKILFEDTNLSMVVKIDIGHCVLGFNNLIKGCGC